MAPSTAGGGGGTTPTGANVQAITVDSGPPAVVNTNGSAVNTAYTTVTVCSPGSTTNCQTIDHIQVDTGSSGLRILASVLTISLPLQTDSNRNVIAECTQFVDGSSWGPIAQADVKIGGETALAQEVQVIGYSGYSTIPPACSSNGATPENDVASFGANGILGVGPFVQDCGSYCEVQGHAIYFTCPTATSCADSGMPLALQVSNPVAAFPTDNNGVIVQLASVASAGASRRERFSDLRHQHSEQQFTGCCESAHDRPEQRILHDAIQAGHQPESELYRQRLQCLLFSRSEHQYLHDQYRLFCPASTLSLSAVMQGISGATATVSFSVANTDNLFKSSSTVIAAASNLAASSIDTPAWAMTTGGFNGAVTFDWGLPFFYGRTVFTAIEGKNTGSGGVGPYFAF